MRIAQFAPLLLVFIGCLGARKQGASFAAPSAMDAPQSPFEAVDPFIGTGGHGHTFPGATLPFGMVQLSPDTRLEGWDGCSGYHYSDSVIYGFSHTHLSGTGVSDYGDILLMPESGIPSALSGYPKASYASSFKKTREAASPGYYQVFLEKPEVDVALTATTHCGLHRYQFPEGLAQSVVLDLAHRDPVLKSGLQIVDDRRVEGFRVSNAWAREQHVYFSLEFSRPFVRHEIAGEAGALRSKEGQNVVARFHFNPDKAPLLVRVGISAVDVEGARRNLAEELPDFAFEATQAAAKAAWEQELSKIEVEGGTAQQRSVFYTALYHSLLAPNTWSDADGRFRGMDGVIQTLPAGDRQYTVFSLWDTFRAAHPLYTLIEPKRVGEFIRTFIRQAQHERLPVWELAANETDCMIGYHSVSVIADAYMKGIRDFDADEALAAMTKSARMDHFGLKAYKSQGMISAGDEAESVSKTLEYAYDDWCIAQMAKAMGRDEVYQEFIARAQFYKNLYDPETGFFRARMNGGWMQGFDPHEVNFNFTEANAWQYSLFAPQDIGTLMDMMGGPKGLEQHLDALFSASTQTTGREQADITGLIGQYAHGNEPSHHMAYLYAYCGAPHKTQALVRRVMDELYAAAPDGLSGNEDCGQMSAWLVMSAMGIYPVTPGSPNYILGSPWFDAVTLHLDGGKSFRIEAQGNAAGSPYVQSLLLNGKEWRRPWISHADMLAGGNLHFHLSSKPNTAWFNAADSIPDLRIDGSSFVVSPFIVAKGQTFSDSMLVEIHSPEPNRRFRVSFDHLTPIGPQAPVYQEPIMLRSDTRIVACAETPDGRFSIPIQAEFFKIDGSRSIQLKNKYANQYAAGGNNALIDRLRGGSNFRTGRWQGYQEDLEATIDLGAVKDIRRISAGFLQDIGSWIWLPSEVRFEYSEDGKKFIAIHTAPSGVSDRDYEATTHDFSYSSTAPLRARYVRIYAKNYGVCPEWHLGAGGKTWIFADEIVIE